MTTFNISGAKARFSELVRNSMLGEEVIIAKDNKPVLKLVPLDKPKQLRKPGSGKGQALVEKLPVITADPVSRKYGVRVIW